LFFPVQERIDVVRGQLDAVTMGDGIRGTRLDAVTAKNATRVVYVVNLGVTLTCRDSIGVGILGSLDVNAIRGTRRSAQKTAYTLLKTVFIALQNVNAAIARLHTGRNVGKILCRGFAEHGPQRHAEAFE
jgi:hypothetical protein